MILVTKVRPLKEECAILRRVFYIGLTSWLKCAALFSARRSLRICTDNLNLFAFLIWACGCTQPN